MDNWLSRYAQQLSNLTADNLPELRQYLADSVEFRDPFNHTYTQNEFIHILEDMYQKLDQVSFQVHSCLLAGDDNEKEGVMYWTFTASSGLTGKVEFEGASRVVQDGDGRVMLHHDFWDASELMQKIPLIGAVIKKLRRKMSH
jgi:hypothetical protein